MILTLLTMRINSVDIERHERFIYIQDYLNKLARSYEFTYDLVFSDKMTRTLARCHQARGMRFATFTFNYTYVTACFEKNRLDLLNNTILHEVAHLLVGAGHHHDKWWRLKFIELGGNPDRDMEDFDTVYKLKEHKKYIFVCPHCGKEYTYSKRIFTNACGECCKKYNNGKWTEKFVLVEKE